MTDCAPTHVSKQRVKVALLLAAYSKMWGENDFKQLFIKRKAQLKDLEDSQPINMRKNKKGCSGKNIKSIAKR